jgi:hypothetical protein
LLTPFPLTKKRPEFVGVVFFHSHFDDAPCPYQYQYGHETVFRVWSWGNDDDEIMVNFESTFIALMKTLQTIAQEL